VRRGYFHARTLATADTDRAAGTVDLELSRGDPQVTLADFEAPVAAIFDELLADGPQPLSHLHASIEEPANVLRYADFKDMVKSTIEARGWYTFTAARVLFLTSIALFALGMVGSFALYTVSTKATLYFGATTIDGAALLFHASWITKLVRRRRRTAAGALEAKRWAAFRRYLKDFPRLEDDPAGSVALWERHLVYAIAFGEADRVLGEAQLHRLEGLSGSPIFWLGLHSQADGNLALVPEQEGSRIGRARVRLARMGR
jgi:uncharacterized membrane protein